MQEERQNVLNIKKTVVTYLKHSNEEGEDYEHNHKCKVGRQRNL